MMMSQVKKNCFSNEHTYKWRCPKRTIPSSLEFMSLDWRDTCIGALICVTFVGALRRGMEKRKLPPLPPGPRPIPLIGNIRGVDINAPWLAYTEWGKQYGACITWKHREHMDTLNFAQWSHGRRNCILESFRPTYCCDQLRESGA